MTHDSVARTEVRAQSNATTHEIVNQANLLTKEKITTLVKIATQFNQTLFQYLLQHNVISPEKFAKACADYFQERYSDQMPHATIENDMLQTICKNHFMLPAESKKNTAIFYIGDPIIRAQQNTLHFQLKKQIEMHWLRFDFLIRAHNQLISKLIYHKHSTPKSIAEHILSDAIHQKASDIHIAPFSDYFQTRFRLDGILKIICELPIALFDGVISCLKILAQMDIAIKRMPQDGRFSFHSYLNFYKNCRVSTCPTIHGEKMVIRLLDHQCNIQDINALGLLPSQNETVLKAIQKPQGLILVTGPTGSGKSITLYTLLQSLNDHTQNILTIEDPVEMQLNGIQQIPVHPKAGLSFSQILRSVLRQDPDIIMVGEIRDTETAEIALRAAQTGHLVLSTLHTNSAAEAITRLTQMGIASYHLASALTLIIAQRLIRKSCQHCRQKGCALCENGYHGRTGIFEVLLMTPMIQDLVLNHASPTQINKASQHISLHEAGQYAVDASITTLSEITRVCQYD